ncbi:MAG: DUF1552 domain-containing protein [Rubripirellula sp.]
MSIHTSRLSRRTVLRGLGVSLALPFLESTVPRVAASQSMSAPQRMAFIFVPNGVHLPDWTPQREGYRFDLPHILQPLASVQDDLTVISGLTHDKGRANDDGAGDHARSALVFLTGAQPRKTDGSDIRSGVSVDQVAAKAAGKATRFASLELGCEPGRGAGGCDSGYSCAYSSNISWSSESTPVGKETNPRYVFERLFGDGKPQHDKHAERRDALKQSVLDYISEDARRLQSKLGTNDQRKLDEYLNSVREVERRFQRADDEIKLSVDVDYPIPRGTPDDYGEHIRLMCDMMVLAFQTDRTRIASFMFADAGSNRSYRHIDVPDGHHDLSHHRGDQNKHKKIREINRFHVAQLAYFLQKLKSTPDGENGNLLDNSMVCYGSAISDGDRHNNENLPIVLAGHAGGSIDSGRHVRVSAETPLCNLFMSMLDRFGTPTDFVGDSTGQVSELQI